MLALVGDESEKVLVEQALTTKEKWGASLTLIHVNDLHAGGISMMMDSPKEIDEDELRTQIKQYGFEQALAGCDIIIVENESISKAIQEHCVAFDLLIVGHRKMSNFKSHIMDSVDEGIVNHIDCPVLVVQKD